MDEIREKKTKRSQTSILLMIAAIFALACQLIDLSEYVGHRNYGAAVSSQTNNNLQKKDLRRSLGGSSAPYRRASRELVRPYPLRDLPDAKKSKVLARYNDAFSDMNRCMDFKCESDVSLCDDARATNYNATSPNGPCCTHVLRDMLRVFDESMKDLGLDYSVVFGTLLGLAREDRVIPWTIDHDIMMDRKTLPLMTELWDAEATGLDFVSTRLGKKQRGFPRMCVTPDFAGGALRRWRVPEDPDVLWPDRGFPYIDFSLGDDVRGEGMYGGEHPRCRHHKRDVYPTRRRPVYGGQFAVNFPADHELLLRRWYGLGWRSPPPPGGEDAHGDNHLTCSVLYGIDVPDEQVDGEAWN